MNNLENYTVPSGKVLILRTSNHDRTSYNGFQWPELGPVKCPYWDPIPACGNGLHGALKGEGDGMLFNWYKDAVWQVIEVDEKDIVELDGKVKFPSGTVVYSGTREIATGLVKRIYGTAVIGCTATAGERGTATAGYKGTATAGDYSTATAGYGGTATAGDWGTATAGNNGTATAGDWGTAIAGERGIATVGYCGRIQIEYWDYKVNRHRLRVGYIGEDGLKPNVKYKLDKNHNFVEVE